MDSNDSISRIKQVKAEVRLYDLPDRYPVPDASGYGISVSTAGHVHVQHMAR